MSYIPRQTKLSRERIEAKLEVNLIRKLEEYCEYLDSDRDYVIAQLLEIAFRKDKGFSAWLIARGPKSPAREPDVEGGPATTQVVRRSTGEPG